VKPRKSGKPVAPLDGLEQRCKVLGSLLRIAEILDPDKGRILGQARRLRRCHGQVEIIRRHRAGAERRARAEDRRRERERETARSLAALRQRRRPLERHRSERRAEIERSRQALADRLAAGRRFEAILLSRGL
jgi:hypothetical protein